MYVEDSFGSEHQAQARGRRMPLRERIVRLAAASGSPRRTAAAFALGVFLSFSPFLGLQIALGLTVALVLRLSRVAVLVGLCTNLPWFMVPWYTLTTVAGAFVLRVPIASDFGSRLDQVLQHPVYATAFWEHAAELIGPFLWAFLIGSTAGALVVGAAAYVALVRMLPRPGSRQSA